MPKFGALPCMNNVSLSRISIRLTLICILASAAVLSGCAGDPTDETAGWSQSKLFSEAKDAMDGGDYPKCVKYFEKSNCTQVTQILTMLTTSRV